MDIDYSVVKERVRGKRLIGEERWRRITLLIPCYRTRKNALAVCALFSYEYGL
jgi:hypothetical protein